MIIALLSLLLKHEKLPWVSWLGIAVSFGGLYLIISRQSAGIALKGSSLAGDLLVFVGNIFWSLYTVFSRPLLDRISPLRLTAWTMGFGALAYAPLAAPMLRTTAWRPIPLGAWGGLAYSAVFALVVGFVVWYSSVKRVGSSRTAIYGNITPVLTAVSAHFILGERLAGVQAVGAAIILTGVYLTRSGNGFFNRRRGPSGGRA